MARSLVTAGAGFIGSNLAEVLARTGGHVRILEDSPIRDRPPATRREGRSTRHRPARPGRRSARRRGP